MTKRKAFMIVQAAACVLLCAMLAAGAVGIYMDGAARRASGDATAWIYTREIVTARLWPAIPVGIAALALTVVGLLLGVRDESKEKPSKAVPHGMRGLRPSSQERERRLGVLRLALLAAAIALIVAGALNGSLRDVFYKAVNTCTECVGLG